MPRAPRTEQRVIWAPDSDSDDDAERLRRLGFKEPAWSTHASNQDAAAPMDTQRHSISNSSTESAGYPGRQADCPTSDDPVSPQDQRYAQDVCYSDDKALLAATDFQNDSAKWCRDASLQLAVGLLAFNLDEDPNADAEYGQTFKDLTKRLYATEGGSWNEEEKSRYLKPFRDNYGLMGKTKTSRGQRDFTAIERDMINANYRILEAASGGPEFAIPERL